MATLARDEEGWWQAEVARIAAQLLLAGKPVRGGGRSAGGGEDRSLSIETARLAAHAPAMQRRLLRYAAEQLGAALDFSATEALRELALTGRASQRCEVAGGVTAERTYREIRLTAHRELRLTAGLAAGSAARASAKGGETAVEYKIPIPGEVAAAGLGLNVRIEVEAPEGVAAVREATLRAWRAGDRVRLRYSSGPRKVKEVLERLHVTGSDRTNWPVLDVGGRVVWMQGVEAEPEPGIAIFVRALRGFPST
jgi:tRNA(Ile)-lysidine synthase